MWTIAPTNLQHIERLTFLLLYKYQLMYLLRTSIMWLAQILGRTILILGILKSKQNKYINNILKTLYFYIKSKIYIPLKQSGNFMELTALFLDWKQTNYLFMWSQALVIATEGRPGGAQHAEEMYHWTLSWKIATHWQHLTPSCPALTHSPFVSFPGDMRRAHFTAQ